jgi:hypothetical protein
MSDSFDKPLMPRAQFIRRLWSHIAVSLALLTFSLGVGIAGYVQFERLSWLDGFLNAAMLLGGMGPVNTPLTPWGKLFAGLYALYAGLVFLIAAGLVLAPIFHRILHKFHLDDVDDDQG